MKELTNEELEMVSGGTFLLKKIILLSLFTGGQTGGFKFPSIWGNWGGTPTPNPTPTPAPGNGCGCGFK